MTSKLTIHQPSHVACRDCSLSSLCLPMALNLKDIHQLDRIIRRGRPLKKGAHLFIEGDSFTSLFAVRSGAIKTYNSTNKGEEQITAFYLPSEILGLSGVDTESYPVSAQAIETTMVCEIPFGELELLSDEFPELRRHIMRLMSKKIREDQQMMMLLSKKNAYERIATFLITLASRFRRRGFSSQSFRIVMSRNEMGNFLGLAVETVSRVFTRFQKNGLILAMGKEIEILEPAALYSLASGKANKQPPVLKATG
ncbi:fumarate/nitrate reduction transcriptional regulator Fnr [Candidatus Sororendozoicomonas aggregata]|uniref:fumarate/nitrate reduction transcriptional regulator Fnr n=1 Tax=Candidatus Sororendozoicomonas aggregata TaxID=3073239 RepID=UPI002ED28BB1